MALIRCCQLVGAPPPPGVAQVVREYNDNPDVHGILVQLPLPKHINEQRVLDAISLEKDVDGFHPENIGALAMRGRTPKYVSCTPKVRRHVLGGIVLKHSFGNIRAASSCCAGRVWPWLASRRWWLVVATLWACPRRCCCCVRMPR